MNGPTSSTAVDKPMLANPEVKAEIGKTAEQGSVRPPSHKTEIDAERIRSSISRLTSNSINGLEGLASELQDLQNFLKSEVERVQGEIDSALAGVKIIIETIGPWRSAPASPPAGARAVRAGPAASIEAGQPRR